MEPGRKKGHFTFRTTAVLLMASAVFELISITAQEPLLGEVRSGLSVGIITSLRRTLCGTGSRFVERQKVGLRARICDHNSLHARQVAIDPGPACDGELHRAADERIRRSLAITGRRQRAYHAGDHADKHHRCHLLVGVRALYLLAARLLSKPTREHAPSTAITDNEQDTPECVHPASSAAATARSPRQTRHVRREARAPASRIQTVHPAGVWPTRS